MPHSKERINICCSICNKSRSLKREYAESESFKNICLSCSRKNFFTKDKIEVICPECLEKRMITVDYYILQKNGKIEDLNNKIELVCHKCASKNAVRYAYNKDDNVKDLDPLFLKSVFKSKIRCRKIDCLFYYDKCLGIAAKRNWNGFSCNNKI